MFKVTVGSDCTGIRNIHSSIHSFRSMSYDRSIASSKSSSPQSVILLFLIMFAVSSPFRKVIQLLLTSYSSYSSHPILPSVFPSVSCFRRQLLGKMWPVHLAFCLTFNCNMSSEIMNIKRVWQILIGRLEKSVSSVELGEFFCAFRMSCPEIITLFVLEGTALMSTNVVGEENNSKIRKEKCV